MRPISKLWPPPRNWSSVLVPSSAVTRAVSSSSLTSNSRSRLRSTMFDFVSIPPPGNQGDGPPQKPPKSHSLGSIESPIDARRKSRLRLLQRINVSSNSEADPPRKGRTLPKWSIIGPAAPTTQHGVGASPRRPVRRPPPARVHVPSGSPNRSPALHVAEDRGRRAERPHADRLDRTRAAESLPLLSAEPRTPPRPASRRSATVGKGDVACGRGARPRSRLVAGRRGPRRTPSPPRSSPGDRSPPLGCAAAVEAARSSLRDSACRSMKAFSELPAQQMATTAAVLEVMQDLKIARRARRRRPTGRPPRSHGRIPTTAASPTTAWFQKPDTHGRRPAWVGWFGDELFSKPAAATRRHPPGHPAARGHPRMALSFLPESSASPARPSRNYAMMFDASRPPYRNRPDLSKGTVPEIRSTPPQETGQRSK